MTQGNTPAEVLQEATSDIDRLSKFLKKSKVPQVRSKDELQMIKATALAWFNNYRAEFGSGNNSSIKIVEKEYSDLFECTSKSTTRDRYQEIIKRLKGALVVFQTQALVESSWVNKQAPRPDFSPLVQDSRMQDILENRWDEIVKCLECGASLAATIMMGGLLEALFLAYANKLSDKGPIFKAKTAPKDIKTGKTLPLNEWTLNAYVEVGAELEWITKPTKDIGIVLRNYRNFIHPERELSTGITLVQEDAYMFWSISTQLTRQILTKAKGKK